MKNKNYFKSIVLASLAIPALAMHQEPWDEPTIDFDVVKSVIQDTPSSAVNTLADSLAAMFPDLESLLTLENSTWDDFIQRNLTETQRRAYQGTSSDSYSSSEETQDTSSSDQEEKYVTKLEPWAALGLTEEEYFQNFAEQFRDANSEISVPKYAPTPEKARSLIRKEIIEEQDRAYEESLRADQEKERKKLEAEKAQQNAIAQAQAQAEAEKTTEETEAESKQAPTREELRRARLAFFENKKSS